jgi:hypothetical protein
VRSRAGDDAERLVVALDSLTNAEAEGDARFALRPRRRNGAEKSVEATVGDSDALEAIEDALRTSPPTRPFFSDVPMTK